MAKKVIKPVHITIAALQPVFNFSLQAKYIFLVLVGFVFYANSIPNKYVLDDNLIIVNNAYVQMGVPGIPKILTHDSYEGYYSNMGFNPKEQELSGGRYRPLSPITFAIEQQFFGNSDLLPYLRHLVNVLAYIACILAIFYFLGNFLLKKIPGGNDVAFMAAFLFAIHPIHTEVVANIKSLDEILSLLFIMLTFIYSLKYVRNRQGKHLILGTGSFLFALLSKEYAITLLFFNPLLFYLLENKKISLALKAGIPYYAVFAVYLLLRYNAVGFHHTMQSSALLGNNPYLYATHAQKAATEWFVLGKYIGLLFFPYPLACDYSYYQIPYHNYTDITVLIYILTYVGIFSWGIILLRKKNILSFAIFFFLLNVLMVSNFIFDVGATMGERLVFHSSLGFVVILSYYLLKASSVISGISLKTKKNMLIGFLAIIGIVCFGETIIRNVQWKEDTSLFIHDVAVVPNSFLVNNNAGYCYIKLSEKKDNTPAQATAYLDSAKKHLFRALYFDPRDEFTYRILGVLYINLGQFDSAKYYYDALAKIDPNLPDMKSNYAVLSQHYFAKGFNLAKDEGKPREGIFYMKKALQIDSTNESIWYDVGIAYYQLQDYDSAKYALIKTLQNKPDSFDAAGAKKILADLLQKKKY